MRILLMCEGTNEEKILNILLDSNYLRISRDDLIEQRVFHIRSLKNSFVITQIKHYGLPIKIYRIGDTQNDNLVIPKELKKYITKKEIYKYCTKPELEMLLILNEGLEQEYEKEKSYKTPKIFAKERIQLNDRKYDQSSEFYSLYFGGSKVKYLVSSIKRYKEYKRHNKGELYLADLLK